MARALGMRACDGLMEWGGVGGEVRKLLSPRDLVQLLPGWAGKGVSAQGELRIPPQVQGASVGWAHRITNTRRLPGAVLSFSLLCLVP